MSEFLLTAEQAREVSDTLNDYLATRGDHREVRFLAHEGGYGMGTADAPRLPLAVYFQGRFGTFSLQITDRQAIQMLFLIKKALSRRASDLVGKFHNLFNIEPKEEVEDATKPTQR